MVFSKATIMKIRAKCEIHNEELHIWNVTHRMLLNELTYELNISICKVDDGCTKENYVVEVYA